MAQEKSGVITVATAGTAVQGPAYPKAGGDRKTIGFYLKASPANAGVVYVGQDGTGDVTSANGFPLSAGESVVVSVNSLDDLWFDAATSGDTIAWLAVGV